MSEEKNLAIICDLRSKSPVGVICACPITGDIAFLTEDPMLEEVLDILLDNKVFLHADEKVNSYDMITEEEIKSKDSYYLMALNYALPFPWRMLGVTPTVGDIEQIVEEASNTLRKGGVNLEEINQKI